MNTRRTMIAKIHVAKKQMGLDDATYRDILSRTVNRNSAADCTDGQLHVVLEALKKQGFRATKNPFPREAQQRMIYAVWKDLQPFVHATDKPAALRAFVQRQTKTKINPLGCSAVEFLDAKQATRVLEGLKSWLARVRLNVAKQKKGECHVG